MWLQQVTFAGATVLLVATLSPLLGESLDVEPGKSSWERAIGILEFYKGHISSAGRGIEVLQQYRASISRRTSTASRKFKKLSSSHPSHKLQATDEEPPAASSATSQTMPGDNMFPPQAYSQPDQHMQGQHELLGQSQHFYTPPQQPQQQQQPQPQAWGPAHAMPTPPAGGMEGGLQEYLASESLNDSWLTTQDFGQGDWLLHHNGFS